MRHEIELSPEEQQDLAFSQKGAEEYRIAEEYFWATFRYGADIIYTEEQENSPSFGTITHFIDNLYTSVSLQEMRDITEEYYLEIGTPDGGNHRGDREIFNRSIHHMKLHPKAEVDYFGQQVECTNSQISTTIKGKEHVLLESTWDNVRLNPVEEDILDEIAQIEEELRARR